MIKLWAWIYRKTGWYAPPARAAEYRHIKKNYGRIEAQYRSWGDVSLEDAIGIEVGSWQAHHGFYRELDLKSLKPKNKIKP